MKKTYLTLCCILIASLSMAQITITNADLPVSGNNYLLSNGSTAQVVDFTTTGPNTTWDFSTLIPVSQDTDSYVSLLSLGSITYGFTFGFGANAANLVTAVDLFAGLPAGTLPISDLVSFFNKSSTSYKQVGLGAALAGIDIPFAFSNKDFVYNLPLNYGAMDSCLSGGSLNVPNTAYIQIDRSRVNHVDGWGSITTPYGTFNALRVRSVVNEFDSLYADTLGFGFGFPQPETIEYKWLANGKGVPVLQINTTVVFGIESVASIRYIDSLRPLGVNEMVNLSAFNVYPNPANQNSIITFELAKKSDVTLKLYALDGKQIAVIENKTLHQGTFNYYLKPEALKVNNGIYLLEVTIDGQKEFRKIVFAD